MNNFAEYNLQIFISPSDVILKTIADKHGDISDKVFRGLKHTIERAKSFTGYFSVVLYNINKDVIGFAHFIQHSKENEKWFFGVIREFTCKTKCMRRIQYEEKFNAKDI